MIFVTIGMHPEGFERLIRKMDQIAGKIDEEVIMQIGGTKYVPQNAKHFDFATGEQIKELCQKARVVVTHGAMTILDALEQGTPVVAVPRLKKYGEVIDDHQLYLVQELEKAGKVTAVYDVEELEEALKKAGTKPAKLVRDKRLVNALKGYIAQFERS
jgi:UDP-N-acetylglucosamine transferase subunit ALG13